MLILIILPCVFFSCTNTKEYLAHSWAITNIKINDLDYGTSLMRVNILDFNNNNTGIAPYMRGEKEKDKIKWDLNKENDSIFITISGSKYDIFNKKFYLKMINKNDYKIRLVSDTVELKCVSLYWD